MAVDIDFLAVKQAIVGLREAVETGLSAIGEQLAEMNMTHQRIVELLEQSAGKKKPVLKKTGS